MDRQARRLKEDQKEDASDEDSGAGSDDGSEENNPSKQIPSALGNGTGNGDSKDPTTKARCGNCCTTASGQFHTTSKGVLCHACYSYWRRTGAMKTSAVKRVEPMRHIPAKAKKKPPRGMYVDMSDLKQISHGPVGHGEVLLKQLDTEVVGLKRQVQSNKQIISQLKHKVADGVDQLRLPESVSTMCNVQCS